MIIAAGLTPAWQQTLTFTEFRPGEVNRARSVHWCASGKVLNVGAALHHLGAASKTVSIFGEDTGRLMRQEFDNRGIDTAWIETQSATRVCTTILDERSGTMTELVQNASAVSAGELDEFANRFAQEGRKADWAVLTGSLPQQTPVEFYKRLMASTSARVILDVRGEELKVCLPLRPFLAKPNREELALTVGEPIRTDAELLAAMHTLRRLGAQRVLVSQDAGELWFLNPAGLTRFRPPRVSAVNPIGCGDCLAAGIAVGLAEGMSEVDAVRFGMAAAADNAGQLLPAQIDRQRAEALAVAVSIVTPES
ncbi:MAG TPA: 1-phosphofructokinase family hexose kinase [Planctomycetaceae bacterium]|nr:1-phosphofructokinase family hexose kinase [Planctomycetaceae bacterium]